MFFVVVYDDDDTSPVLFFTTTTTSISILSLLASVSSAPFSVPSLCWTWTAAAPLHSFIAVLHIEWSARTHKCVFIVVWRNFFVTRTVLPEKISYIKYYALSRKTNNLWYCASFCVIPGSRKIATSVQNCVRPSLLSSGIIKKKMPFISKDWRSPGEAWVKTDDGWEKLKVLECGKRKRYEREHLVNMKRIFLCSRARGVVQNTPNEELYGWCIYNVTFTFFYGFWARCVRCDYNLIFLLRSRVYFHLLHNNISARSNDLCINFCYRVIIVGCSF